MYHYRWQKNVATKKLEEEGADVDGGRMRKEEEEKEGRKRRGEVEEGEEEGEGEDEREGGKQEG